MHALIALGAENTTGPWLCLRCGRNGHPISIPSYRGFRRHLINTHKESIDPALCEYCGWRSVSKRELHFHMQLEHKVKTNLYIFPECQLCQQMCIDSDGLNQHLIESHPDENKQQCIYCNKIFPEELQLYTHMKTFHKKQALEDGIIDYSDDENQAHMNLQTQNLSAENDKEMLLEHKETQQTKKIKILSDISLPIASSIMKTDSFVRQQEQTAAVTSEEYLHDQEQDQDNTETKFVAADGSEVILTAEQRKEILSQLNQEHEGSGIVMVLNENQHQQQCGSGDTQSDHGAISQDETSQATTATNEGQEEEEDGDEEHIAEDNDEHDDNQIYNEMKSLHPNLEDQEETSQTETAAEVINDENSMHEEETSERDERAVHLEESKESVDNLEWAENLISEHDLADEVLSQSANENAQLIKSEEKDVKIKDDDNKSQDEISKKLKELTGDWSEDDDDDMPEEEPIAEIKENIKEKEHLAVAGVKVAEEAVEQKESETNEVVKEQEKNPDFDEHADLLASLQSTEKMETDNLKHQESVVAESENIDEDDIDMALKSLHKEDIEEDDISSTEKRECKPPQEVSEKNGSKMAAEHAKQTIHEMDKKEDKKPDINIPVESGKTTKTDENKPEESILKEEQSVNVSSASSATMEVDDKTKKDLIDSLLSVKCETLENTPEEISNTRETLKKLELETAFDVKPDKVEKNVDVKNDTNESTEELQNCEEFLDATPEKTENANKEATTTATTTDITSDVSSTTKVAESPSTSVKEQSAMSSEEQVKNLISEWGDDEDEDENDPDLPANL